MACPPGPPIRHPGLGEAQRRKLADGERGQVNLQLRAGDGAGQHDRCPRLSQHGGYGDHVFGDAEPLLIPSSERGRLHGA
jgi:hypothetical protein